MESEGCRLRSRVVLALFAGAATSAVVANTYIQLGSGGQYDSSDYAKIIIAGFIGACSGGIFGRLAERLDYFFFPVVTSALSLSVGLGFSQLFFPTHPNFGPVIFHLIFFTFPAAVVSLLSGLVLGFWIASEVD